MQSVCFDRIQHFNENAKIMNENNFVKLGDVAHECRLTWSGDQTNIPIVGLEHLIPGEIELYSWDSNIEHTFSKKFVKGQVLLGRRRVYLKKAVMAPCDGICSGDITVIESTGGILPELLPFVIQNDRFFDYAMQGSAGSLSPRVKWEHLKNYEFPLPPLTEQKVLADKLWAAYRLKESYKKLLAATEEMVKSQFIEMFGDPMVNDKQWSEYSCISEITQIVLGSTPNSKEPSYWDGDIRWITPAEMTDQSYYIFDTVRKICIVIVVALIIVTAFLIANTIKITIFSRKKEIEIMRLVGASNTNIKIPFIMEGLFLGILGSILPVVVTIIGYDKIYEHFNGRLFVSFITLEKTYPFVLYISGILVVIGMIVGMFGSWRAVRKYLKI